MRVPSSQPTRLRSLLAGALLAWTAGCTGVVGDVGGGVASGPGGVNGGTNGTAGAGVNPNAPDVTAAACARSGGVLNAGTTPLRRLTRDQYNNTVRDLLGAAGLPADNLADDEKIGPFHSNAIAPITELEVQQYMEVGGTLATAAVANISKLSPCDLATDTGTATTCATQLVTQLGRRAYRRPLSSAEVQQYLALYTLGKQGAGVQNGFRLVVQTLLQSPFFLYHHDVGGTGAPQSGVVAVSPYELASRMSYFLWNTMPDEPLFAAAAAGTLADDTALTGQVQRMLADPRATPTIASFHRQWLDVEDVGDQSKDGTMFPGFNSQLTDAMTQELSLFSNYVVLKGDGLLKTLLTSNMAFPQGGLFAIYGVAQPAGFTAGTPVMLDATRRAGVLTQAAFLTKWSHADQTSPVHRGKLVRLNLLCGFIGSPPPGVNTSPPTPTPATSTRERFAQHESDPVCASCHLLMDPIGLGLENFDSVGAFRTVDGLGAVDATGRILNAGPDLDGSFNGAIELANRLAQSSEVRDCVANQWFRFSLGRMESTNDACSIQALHDNFKASGGNIRDLLARIVLSPAFRSVRLNGG
jgi:Protein of unknown function (DUF1592)/Protein of unknown function (DUF1588)/Protein of unknown function (DUF1585)/Protein of unknown function (DUF1595)/Protein of unknown function (DUF1587)